MSSLIPVFKSSFNSALDRDFDNLFDSFFDFQPRARGRRSTALTSNIPRANVSKTNHGYTIQLAVPGFSRDDFEVNVEDGALTVAANIVESHEEGKEFASREFNYASFTRSWTLPEGIETGNICARYDAGILSLDIPAENRENAKMTVEVS